MTMFMTHVCCEEAPEIRPEITDLQLVRVALVAGLPRHPMQLPKPSHSMSGTHPTDGEEQAPDSRHRPSKAYSVHLLMSLLMPTSAPLMAVLRHAAYLPYSGKVFGSPRYKHVYIYIYTHTLCPPTHIYTYTCIHPRVTTSC